MSVEDTLPRRIRVGPVGGDRLPLVVLVRARGRESGE